MRAKISYEVEFDDVLEETNNLVLSIIKKFNLSQEVLNISDIIHSGNVGRAMELIDVIRQELMKVDVRLNDCSEILQGYQKALVSKSDSREGVKLEE